MESGRVGPPLQVDRQTTVMTPRCTVADGGEIDSDCPGRAERGRDALSGLGLQRDSDSDGALGLGSEPEAPGADAGSHHRAVGPADRLKGASEQRGILEARWAQGDSAGGGPGRDDGWDGQCEVSIGSGWDWAQRGFRQRSSAAGDIEDVLAAAPESGGPDLDEGRPTQRQRRAQLDIRSVASLQSFACGS